MLRCHCLGDGLPQLLQCHSAVMRLLLSHGGASLDVANAAGVTALHYVAAAGAAHDMSMRADGMQQAQGMAKPVNSQSSGPQDGQGALTIAEGDLSNNAAAGPQFALAEALPSSVMDTLELLLSAGANLNARDAHGQTPLHVAAEAGALALCHRLLAAGALPNVQVVALNEEPSLRQLWASGALLAADHCCWHVCPGLCAGHA